MRFTAVADCAADPRAAFDRVTDWEAHTRWVPLTTVRLTRGDGGVGSRFTGRSGLGPLAFDDPMEVLTRTPPDGDREGRCAVVKLGSVVTGRAEVVVRALPAGGSRVEWTEDVEVAPARLTRPLAPVLALGGRLAFTAVLRSMARELAAEAAGRRGA